MPRSPMLGEFDLIERFFARSRTAAGAGVILGVGDDAALLDLPAGTHLAAAVDTLVCGRHFPGDMPAHAIGYRALAVNLSDLAAMGATPAWATLALTLPHAEEAWLEPFARGFYELADTCGVTLVGGDTTAGPLTVSVQILGYVARGTALRRSGARPGDCVVVTGTLGDAAAGLAVAQGRLPPSAAAQVLRRRFEYPEPRVAFGQAARGIASAAMDLSDGLGGDLAKLTAASMVGAQVAVDRLPLSAALRTLGDEAQRRRWALCGGDDYELLLTVPPQQLDRLRDAAHATGTTLTVVGEIRAQPGVLWTLNGAPYAEPAGGYDHFGGPSTEVTV